MASMAFPPFSTTNFNNDGVFMSPI